MCRWYKILIIIIIIIFFSCGELDRTFSRAKKLSASRDPKDWEKAIAEYQKIIDYKVEAREKQGLLYRKLGDRFLALERWNDAIENYKKAIEVMPAYAYLYHQLALAYGQLIKLAVDSAERENLIKNTYENYIKALRLQDDYIDVRYGLGILYFYYMDRREEAIAQMNWILQREKKNIKAMFALARFYYELDDLKTSLEYYQKLVSLLPKGSPELKNCRDNITRILEELKAR